MLTVVILCHNEALHIERAIRSVAPVVSKIVVVDSGSTDATVSIAARLGAQVLSHPWTNYATQFNWALEQLPAETTWVLRLDADEIVTPALADEIQRKLASLPAAVHGVYVTRQVTFMGRLIRYGGTSPIRVLRLFRYRAGRCENRWMDEHIKVDGATVGFDGTLVDDNLNSVSWWIDKHNRYASREVVDLLNITHRFIPQDSVAGIAARRPDGVKRWIKEKIYARLPAGHRVLLYFLYRYVLKLGFLDGPRGTAFHFLQGYWYRYLVDIKLMEVKRCMQEKSLPPAAAIREVLGIDVGGER